MDLVRGKGELEAKVGNYGLLNLVKTRFVQTFHKIMMNITLLPSLLPEKKLHASIAIMCNDDRWMIQRRIL